MNLMRRTEDFQDSAMMQCFVVTFTATPAIMGKYMLQNLINAYKKCRIYPSW